ncbi:GBS Bsp-like repeat-containing protein [Acetobacterium tundrae]|uniref:CHAP domain-containing protein n=1 Tax=Acetobacterium tundrae TaxID=132932 RepID=A0ABR6WLD2_9FIRM|nr:GBS Bsp-like repeat-containing protein [Acetobacterium tundrae]MBC3797289.1 CHAP domain-containing protein [Acetobacterium tundrae]
MKKRFFKNACFSIAFILFLGLLPGAVMAEENGANNPAVTNTAAAAQVLPVLYAARMAVPGTDNPYFYADNAYYQGGYGMPNCTAYAWGRAYEILGTKPNLCTGNANQWWDYNLSNGYYPSGSAPKLGAIICWGSGSSGHVAVVESIVDNVVTLSESTWSGILFSTYSYSIGAEDATSVGGFQGYIYIGDYVDASSDITPPVLSDVQVTEADENGFTVSCTVSDVGTGVDKVMFPVWTDKDGQDDLVWYPGTISGNTASCRVLYADHNGEAGDYIIHVYAYDKAGLSTTAAVSMLADNGKSTETFKSIGDIK